MGDYLTLTGAAAVSDLVARAVRIGRACEAISTSSQTGTQWNYDLLVLLKPELFEYAPGKRIDVILEKIWNKLIAGGLTVTRAAAWPAEAPEVSRALRQTYTQLDQVAYKGVCGLSMSSGRKLASLECYAGFPVEGAFATLARVVDINAQSLEALARATTITKLGHNSYACLLELGGSSRVILNAFWPGLLRHLTARGTILVALHCLSRLPAHKLQMQTIGVADPDLAHAESIRATIAHTYARWGLPAPTIGRNGIHLSPGFVEAAFAVEAFFPSLTGHFESVLESDLFNFGIPRAWFASLRSNPEVSISSSSARVFELTEGLGPQETFEILRRLRMGH